MVSRIQMSGPVGRWVCGLLLLTLGLTAACTSGPNQKSAAVTTPPSAPATSPAALLGSPHRSEQATVERVRAYLESNRLFQHILTDGFGGRVLCGVYLWGTSASKHEIYASATCGNYGVVNGAATQVSGYSTLVVLTTAGAPTTTSIISVQSPRLRRGRTPRHARVVSVLDRQPHRAGGWLQSSIVRTANCSPRRRRSSLPASCRHTRHPAVEACQGPPNPPRLKSFDHRYARSSA